MLIGQKIEFIQARKKNPKYKAFLKKYNLKTFNSLLASINKIYYLDLLVKILDEEPNGK